MAAVLCLPVGAAAQTTLRYSVTLTQGSAEDGQGERTAQLAEVLAQPDDLTQCRKTASCQSDRVTLLFDRSPTLAAAASKLRSGVAQLLIVPAPLLQLMAGAGTRELPSVPGLQALAGVGQLRLFVLAQKDVKARTFAELQKRRFAFSGSNSDITQLTKTLLASMNLPSGSYEALHLSDTTDRLRRVVRGQADVLVLLTPELPADILAELQAGNLQLVSPGKSEVQQALLGLAGLSVANAAIASLPAYRTIAVQQILAVPAALKPDVAASLLDRFSRGSARGATPLLALEPPASGVPHHVAAFSVKQTPPATSEGQQP